LEENVEPEQDNFDIFQENFEQDDDDAATGSDQFPELMASLNAASSEWNLEYNLALEEENLGDTHAFTNQQRMAPAPEFRLPKFKIQELFSDVDEVKQSWMGIYALQSKTSEESELDAYDLLDESLEGDDNDEEVRLDELTASVLFDH